MGNTARILVVDDDTGVRDMLSEYLADHGFVVHAASSAADLRSAIERELPDVVLLDIRLPGEDGLSLARYLRERYDVGIIMVSGADATVDRVVGLEIGADDYVAKPFDPRELLARIKSLLRRMQARPPAAAAPGAAAPSSGAAARAADARVRCGKCLLDVEGRRLFDAGGEEMAMTAMEYELLRVLIDNPNRVLSRNQLLNQTRNRDWEPFDRSIDIRIGRLRRKVEADPENPRTIRTVRNAGYMFVPDS